MEWKECCYRRIAKSITPDTEMVKSLVMSSRNKLESEKTLEMSEVTAASKVSLAYESLRELLEALAIVKGYKIYNHECYAAFLKEVIDESEKGDEFNEIRKIRNSINYYGKNLSPGESQEILTRIKTLISFIKKLLDVRNI